MNRVHCFVLSMGCLLATIGLADGQTPSQRIRGDVVALNEHKLEVKTGAGQVVTVRLADNVRVSARLAADLRAITPGTFIGTTEKPQPDRTRPLHMAPRR